MIELSVIIAEAFVPEAQSLFEQLRDEVEWGQRMRARQTASFGEPYNYSGISYPFQPMPVILPLHNSTASGLITTAKK